ncbi:ATP-binding protein [Candidatus Shapirobacteria bacterium]|nr:ATP-binding protein [Candidatus Shapirobacteria bacterium]
MVITGFRRTGKTYLLFGLINELLQSYSRGEVIYLNFEDERLPQKVEILSQLLGETQAVFGQKPKFLFLDEIQNIPGWSKWVRRILDTEEIKIFLTGSSSKISSLELPTELRGRALEKRVSPLNFREFLRFKQAPLDFEKIPFLESEQAKFDFLFDEFLLSGSLPEVVLGPPEKRDELLQSYFQTVVRKEIIERFKIKNEEALKTILRLLLNSTYFTVSKIYQQLKSLGLAVGKTTVNEYLSYIKSSYFLRDLLFYSASMLNQLQYPRKAYFVDNGFLTFLSTKFSKNYGRLFENFVFGELAKSYEEIFYYKDAAGYEADFVILEEGKAVTIYQVCYDLSDWETKEREVKALLRAGEKLDCRDLRLLTRYLAGREEEIGKIKTVAVNDFLTLAPATAKSLAEAAKNLG